MQQLLNHYYRTGELPADWRPEPRPLLTQEQRAALETGCLDTDDPRHPNHPLHCARPCCVPRD